MMETPRYEIDIFWSEEDGGFIADVPDLKYCSAWGETYEDALREVLVAMDLHLETLREDGRPIPEPKARQAS
jgi:predicted RNase H-like HicB family nuclease